MFDIAALTQVNDQYAAAGSVTSIRNWELERDEVRLNHLMAENRFTRLGAVRSAMWCIGQAAQRRRWTDFPHPDGHHGVDKIEIWAGRFCPLASLACACGGATPRRATRLARDQNRHGQMIQSNLISL